MELGELGQEVEEAEQLGEVCLDSWRDCVKL